MNSLQRTLGTCHGRPFAARRGFTLVELLVVMAILGMLAGMLAPRLSRARSKAQGILCLSNTRQLALGWLLYADDHEGALCPNGPGARQGWIEGTLSFDNTVPDNTNTLYLADPQYAKLAPYVSSATVYRCPSDQSIIRIRGARYPRVRSLAMNDAVGSNAQGGSLPASEGWRIYHKTSDLVAPGPASLWVLIEQHPDSINDGRFALDCKDQGQAERWIDFPANFHNRACSLSFADGHSEMHRWVENVTVQPNRYCGCLSHYAAAGIYVECPNSVDMAWLQARTSARR